MPGPLTLQRPTERPQQHRGHNLTLVVFHKSRGIPQRNPWWFLDRLCKLGGDHQGLTGFGIETTDRKRAEGRLAVHETISEILTFAVTVSVAYPHILKATCETFEWKATILWRMDDQCRALGAANICQPDSAQTRAISSSKVGWAALRHAAHIHGSPHPFDVSPTEPVS